MKIRGTFKISGQVLAFGYRNAVLRLARKLGLTGYFQVWSPESVMVIAEGGRMAIRTLPSLLRVRAGRVRVRNVKPTYSRATGDYQDFQSVPSPNLTYREILKLNKMDEAVFLLKEISAKFGRIDKTIRATNRILSGRRRPARVGRD